MVGIRPEIKFTAAILCDHIGAEDAFKLILIIPMGIDIQFHARAARCDPAENFVKFVIRNHIHHVYVGELFAVIDKTAGEMGYTRLFKGDIRIQKAVQTLYLNQGSFLLGDPRGDGKSVHVKMGGGNYNKIEKREVFLC